VSLEIPRLPNWMLALRADGKSRKTLKTCSGNGGNCVEVASNLPGIVAVRDSKEREGPALALSDRAWSAFTEAIKDGELGL
jgi:Domain of unknown function (DUF397)